MRAVVGLVVGLVLFAAAPLEAQRVSMDNGANASLTSTSCPGTGCVTFDVNLNGSAAVQVTGSWTATLSFQGSIDGATFQTLNATPTNSSTSVTTTTSNGLWTMSVGGLRYVRVVATAYTSGTAVVSLQWAPSGGSSGGGGGGGGSDVTIHDPTITTQKVAVNASGQMSITCANCSGSGASAVDRAAFTFGTDSLAPSGGVFDDTPPAVLTTGLAGVFRSTAYRGLHVNPRTAAGAEMVGSGAQASAMRVTGASDANFRTSQIQQAQQTGASLQAAVTANANGTTLGTQGYSTVLLEVQCTACAGGTTINFEGETGNLNFIAAFGSQVGTNTIATTTTTAGNTMWQFDVAGFTGIRARISNYSAGTVTVDYMMLALPHSASTVNANVVGTVPVSGTFWQATQPVSGTVTTTPPANASTNVAQLAGTATSVNSGTKDAGTLRIVLATDQPALTNKLLVTPDSVALPANQSVNVSQINAVTPLMGNGPTGTGSQRVTIASDNTAFSVNANAGTNLNTSALALSATQTDRTQKTQITDGTRDGTVKAASTLPLLTDTAVVTTQRDPLPAGTNVLGHVIVDATSTTTVTQATGTNLHIVCDSGCGSPPATADGTAFTAGSTNVSPTAGVFNDSIAALTTGTYGAPRLTANRALHVDLRDSNGLERGILGNPTIVADISSQQQLALVQKQGLRLAGTFGRAISSSGDALDVNVRYGDPCGGMAKASVAISQTANTRIVVGQARRVFICSVLIVAADAENLSIVEGSGTTCGTGTTAVIGGTTAALGTNLAANGGWSLSGGGGAVAISDGMDLCLLQSGAGRVAGVMTYALAQ